MKKALLLFLFVTFTIKAQFSFVTSSPADGAVNVGLNDTLSFTFSAPIDTMNSFKYGDQYFSNVAPPFMQWFSADLKTVYFVGNLDSAKNYFFLFHGVKSASGEKMEVPALIQFTTDSVFSGYSISGNVSIEDDSVSPQYSLVAFLAAPLGGGSPFILHAAIADQNGDYTANYLPNGVYYPVAVKDVNGNGEIDPSEGDYIGEHDSVVVDGADLDSVNFVLGKVDPVRFAKARAILDSIRNSLPENLILYFVEGWGVDSLAGAKEWNFYFLNTTLFQAFRVYVSPFGHEVEPLEMDFFNWLRDFRPLADSFSVAAIPDSFINKIEHRIGRALRHRQLADSIGFEVSISLGDLSHYYFADMIPQQGEFYWGLRYAFYNKNDTSNGGIPYSKDFIAKLADTQNEEYKFLADYKTGQEVSVTSVDNNGKFVPLSFELKQNYPNPFNPTTVIQYQIPETGFVTLKIYDILGNEVATLINKQQQAGAYRVNFNAGNLSSGVYFYELKTGNFVNTKKMILLR